MLTGVLLLCREGRTMGEEEERTMEEEEEEEVAGRRFLDILPRPNRLFLRAILSNGRYTDHKLWAQY
jgi:hypothetical protein